MAPCKKLRPKLHQPRQRIKFLLEILSRLKDENGKFEAINLELKGKLSERDQSISKNKIDLHSAIKRNHQLMFAIKEKNAENNRLKEIISTMDSVVNKTLNAIGSMSVDLLGCKKTFTDNSLLINTKTVNDYHSIADENLDSIFQKTSTSNGRNLNDTFNVTTFGTSLKNKVPAEMIFAERKVRWKPTCKDETGLSPIPEVVYPERIYSKKSVLGGRHSQRWMSEGNIFSADKQINHAPEKRQNTVYPLGRRANSETTQPSTDKHNTLNNKPKNEEDGLVTHTPKTRVSFVINTSVNRVCTSLENDAAIDVYSPLGGKSFSMRKRSTSSPINEEKPLQLSLFFGMTRNENSPSLKRLSPILTELPLQSNKQSLNETFRVENCRPELGQDLNLNNGSSIRKGNVSSRTNFEAKLSPKNRAIDIPVRSHEANEGQENLIRRSSRNRAVKTYVERPHKENLIESTENEAKGNITSQSSRKSGTTNLRKKRSQDENERKENLIRRSSRNRAAKTYVIVESPEERKRKKRKITRRSEM